MPNAAADRHRRPSRRRDVQRRRRILIVALAGLLIGGIVATVWSMTRGPDLEAAAKSYADAWRRGDRTAMFALTSRQAREIAPDAKSFSGRFEDAATTATAHRLEVGRPVESGDGHWRLPVVGKTRSFGTVAGTIDLHVVDESGKARIDWRPYQVFPGMRPGEKLSRVLEMPDRAGLLARDGTVLASGPQRSGSAGPAAADIVGTVGPVPDDRKQEIAALGYPSGTKIGINGLERIFDRQLAGVPGGRLLSGTRLIASRTPTRAKDVRTSITTSVQNAAVEALAGRVGGVAVIDPRKGEVLAIAGFGFSGLQPPGSTFKIITAAAGLEAGITRPAKKYPVETAAVLEGVELNNSFKEACGGTLVASFAKSCNSVFAPMGAQLGGKRLVAMAEAFGFNKPIGFAGAAISTMPKPEEITDDLAAGSTAIGQGKVQATALQMAIVAATVGLGGRHPQVTMQAGRWPRGAPTTKAMTPRTASELETLMEAVVKPGGTGTSAAISSVKVAGKTGTAELKTVDPNCIPDPNVPDKCPVDGDPKNTDAWFSAYAPAGRRQPRIAVGVLLVGEGHGGTTAAPAAKQAMVAGLKATRP